MTAEDEKRLVEIECITNIKWRGRRMMADHFYEEITWLIAEVRRLNEMEALAWRAGYVTRKEEDMEERCKGWKE